MKINNINITFSDSNKKKSNRQSYTPAKDNNKTTLEVIGRSYNNKSNNITEDQEKINMFNTILEFS